MVTSRAAACFAACLLGASAQAHDLASPQACRAAAQQTGIAVLRDTVSREPQNAALRIKLANLWSDAGCFNEAVQVLQQGRELAPNDAELEARLKMARSNISEQTYFDNLDLAEKAARLSRDNLRCSKLNDLNACSEALAIEPNDTDLLLAQADALSQLKRPAEAIPIYRDVLAINHSDVAATKLAAAEAQRQTYLGSCQTQHGEAALQACQSAWLAGSADSFAINRRRGMLLQEQNLAAQALDAFIAAEREKSGDRAVALAILSLAASTGRKDAIMLAARGSALLTLGRPADAVEPLRAALKLEPGFADTRAALGRVEAQLQSQNETQAADRAAVPSERREPRYSNELPASRSN